MENALYRGEQTICTQKGRTFAFVQSDLLEKMTGYCYCVGDADTVDLAIRAAVFGKHAPKRDYLDGTRGARFYVTQQAASREYKKLCK